jgi:hypothetical protein
VHEQTTYLVEWYAPDVARAEVEAAAARISASVADPESEGQAIAYIGALLVPHDEMVFHLFTASSEAAVRDASLRAAVVFDRVVEAVPYLFANEGRTSRKAILGTTAGPRTAS